MLAAGGPASIPPAGGAVKNPLRKQADSDR